MALFGRFDHPMDHLSTTGNEVSLPVWPCQLPRGAWQSPSVVWIFLWWLLDVQTFHEIIENHFSLNCENHFDILSYIEYRYRMIQLYTVYIYIYIVLWFTQLLPSILDVTLPAFCPGFSAARGRGTWTSWQKHWLPGDENCGITWNNHVLTMEAQSLLRQAP